jgi:hypothetical protein
MDISTAFKYKNRVGQAREANFDSKHYFDRKNVALSDVVLEKSQYV